MDNTCQTHVGRTNKTKADILARKPMIDLNSIIKQVIART